MKKIFTKIILLAIVIANTQNANAQNWQFKKGTQATNSNPVYNTLGTPNATTSPGARIGMAGFADPNAQTLYLFGGQNGNFNYFNSTFVYNTSNNSWNYTAGQNSANGSGAPPVSSVGYPSARAGMGYTQVPQGASARMLLIGGVGTASNNFTVGVLNSVWKTSTTTPNFENLLGNDNSANHNATSNFSGSGSGFDPGSLSYPCVFSDVMLSGTWQFGGIDVNGLTNNAMLYRTLTTASNTSTKLAGSSSTEDAGTYNGEGTTGTPAARAYATYWRDASGNFWIFGGASNTEGVFNDLWKFNPTTNVFTQVKGTSKNTTANYGTVNNSTSTTFPPARTQAAVVVGTDGKFYIFGGANGSDYYNDLWQFNPTTNQWAWLKGSNTPNAFAFGFGGANSPTATPGAAKGAMAWRINTTMYIYGGEGYVASGSVGRLADLWSIPLNNFTVTVLPISLNYFTATLKDNTTNLAWETSSELNTNKFEIQYSNDGVNFAYATAVSATGNSSSLQKYAATHFINNSELHYYRLKTIDNDGRFYYSNVIKLKSIRTSKSLDVEAYPNITTSQTTLSIHANSNGTASILIQNMLGQPVKYNVVKLNGSSQTIPIDLSSFSKGIFNIMVQVGEEKKSIQIIKQ
jgi:Galactose oxidase, central domain